jgi:hypothetical protein
MPVKLSRNDVKIYIESKGDTLISEKYDNNKNVLDITCGVCKKNYNQTFDHFQRGYQHAYCVKERFGGHIGSGGGYKKPVTLKPIICVTCKKEFQPKRSAQKLCSKECVSALWQTDEYKEIKRISGQKGGKISATLMCKRSKNEIYFSELCAKEFEITTNEPYFDGWDADVIIHAEKTAILWNGIWHYKQIIKGRSLKHQQTRDRVKTAIIKKYGYIPYVIKDMGQYNKAFVEQEFEIFKLMRIDV